MVERSDSFDIRVCDDLSEFVLMFLSIEDKFRYECVSKQFQKTIYQRHHSLVIEDIELLSDCHKSIDLSSFEVYRMVFQKCLKKLPNIKIFKQNNNYPIDDLYIDFIIKYCPNLVSIDCNLSKMSDTTHKKFCEKFGSQLVSISANPEDIQRINSFINLEELKLITLNTNPLFDRLSKLNLNHLKKLTINLGINPELSEEVNNDFKTFVENHKTITHLTLIFLDNYLLEFVFKCLSQLKDLVYLRVEESVGIDCDSLTKQLKQMTNNCLKLKYFGFEWFDVREKEIEMTLLLNELNKFKHLKRLSLSMKIWLDNSECEHVHFILNNSFKAFKNLTHLRLEFPYWYTIDRRLLTDIDINLPKLQSLVIRRQINATQRTADTLSRLSRLETLDLYVTDESIADIIRTQVIKNCKKIKSIETLDQSMDSDSNIMDGYSPDDDSDNSFIASDNDVISDENS